MLVRVKHVEHGFDHVYDQDQLESRKQRGWQIDQVIDGQGLKDEDVPPVSSVVTVATKRRGRPPKAKA